jgi:EamA domain-containing membrane protein RarD
MKKHVVTVPEVGLIAMTRAMLGAGIGLLVSEKLTPEHRRAIGWTLVAIGVVTTVPLAMEVLGDQE